MCVFPPPTLTHKKKSNSLCVFPKSSETPVLSSIGFTESCTWEIEEGSQPTLPRKHLNVLAAHISVGLLFPVPTNSLSLPPETH